MRWLTRTNGLICGGLTAIFCIGDFITRCLATGSWLWIPVSALTLWGLISYYELDQENNRRERILRKMGVSESEELTRG